VPQKDLARQAGKFVKHVVPAAIKPVHSLWHEILGFIFLAIAVIVGAGALRNHARLGPGRLLVIIPVIAVTAVYGVSSFLKARRISRS
jgi:hypothetical protein